MTFYQPSSLLQDIINKLFPGGFPSEDILNQMSIEEKKKLYNKQKLIILQYREASQQETIILHNKLNDLNNTLNILRKESLSNCKPTETDSSPIKLRHNPIVSMPMYRSRITPHRNNENINFSSNHLAKPTLKQTNKHFSKLGLDIPHYKKQCSRSAILVKPRIPF